MFGSHLSIAGSMVNALTEAARLKMDCVQVFTKNQRQWRASPLKPEEVAAWKAAVKKMGWETTERLSAIGSRLSAEAPAEGRKPKAESLGSTERLSAIGFRLSAGAPAEGRKPKAESLGTSPRIVSHNSYLINMASPDPAMWEKSVKLQRIELERCEELGIRLCVAHPGAHLGPCRPAGQPHELGSPPTRDEIAGMKRIVKALDRLHRELRSYRVLTCLETTVGSGSNLGYDFAQLARIRESVKAPERVAFCFDTCHVTAAGYDMTTDAAAEAVIEHFDSICGLEHLRVFHLNDSAGTVGSRRDRHAHIGLGMCGLSCFRAIVTNPAFDFVPKILETPKENTEKGEPWDVANIRRLKRLKRGTRHQALGTR